MFAVWCSVLPRASARPGLSPFVFVVVIGVTFLRLWGFCSPWGVRLLPLGGCVGDCLLALWGFCLLCCVSLPLGGSMGPTATLRLALMVGVVFCASGFVRPGG